MHIRKKALFAAGLLAGAAALTGCTMISKPMTSPTPMAAQQRTPAPATAEPSPQATADADVNEPEALELLVGGEAAEEGAIVEDGELLLPLAQTAQKLGWKVGGEQTEEETQTKCVITLEKDDSRITVAWTVSDNTARNISWQKDGLLIPVDTRITTLGDIVYVPAAFFEEATGVSVVQKQTNVIVSTPKPVDTPKMMQDSSGENG
ncbi:MAG: hypothetical protein IKJ11_02180 [Clostridia bacterium]|nr:hypothetical protein [Clostridia bacterium]